MRRLISVYAVLPFRHIKRGKLAYQNTGDKFGTGRGELCPKVGVIKVV